MKCDEPITLQRLTPGGPGRNAVRGQKSLVSKPGYFILGK